MTSDGAVGGDRPAPAVELDLQPHPEGGWYRQLWEAREQVATARGERAAGTAVHYLLAPGETSRWHSVAADELWLWQGGGPLTLTRAPQPVHDGAAVSVVLGPDRAAGQALHALVPAGHWQTAHPSGTSASLVACVVAPGFTWQDFTVQSGPGAEPPPT
ncbi:cupin domain-containing protein [Streptomyces sp. NPDC059740]|uniref:cupin domain-containing protein n=1 Tax=Streptomyces sp. NPDC059740 TaxID=3346926 RepID=UPI0036583CF1